MSGEEEREHFVTHLLIAHFLSRFLILRLQEHGEQILPLHLPLAMLSNHAMYDCIQRLYARLHALIAWSGNTERGKGKIEVLSQECQDRGKGLSNTIRFIIEVNAEERLADNAQGQPHHLLGHIQW